VKLLLTWQPAAAAWDVQQRALQLYHHLPACHLALEQFASQRETRLLPQQLQQSQRTSLPPVHHLPQQLRRLQQQLLG
jgi:hypothetical protein